MDFFTEFFTKPVPDYITINAVLYTLAALMSAVLGVFITNYSLTRRKRMGKTIVVWAILLIIFAVMVFFFVRKTSQVWHDYFVFFGWMIIFPTASIILYDEPTYVKLFTGVSATFILLLTSFVTGIFNAGLVKNIAPFGEDGVKFFIPFIIFKIIISVLTYILFYFFARKIVRNSFGMLSDKIVKYIHIPFIASLGFFFIAQIVQSYGLMPDVGLDFVLFYLILCSVFGMMYWLIFSNAIWNSRVIKTSKLLNQASHLQQKMLPYIFSVLPTIQEVDICAKLIPSKDGGGDCYDYFLIDNDHLAVVIYDVSGKSVPAAMYMLITKCLIRSNSHNNPGVSEVFYQTNNQLCETNDSGMFVTAFMGILQISTGILQYVNAGHTPPLIKRVGEKFEWLPTKPGFILAGNRNIEYQVFETELKSGDILFMCTDGITEAMDKNYASYTEDKLLDFVNKRDNYRNLEDLLTTIKTDVDAFIGKASQFDDVTMFGMQIK